MKRFARLAGRVSAIAAALFLTVTVSPPPAPARALHPRELVRVQLATAEAQVMNAKCKVTATNPSVGSTGSDADCVWAAFQNILMQCDGAVNVTWDNSTPDGDSPKVAVGDPYPIRAPGSSATPIKFLPITSTVTCNFFYAP